MVLHPILKQRLQGKRTIDLSDNRDRGLSLGSTDPRRVPRSSNVLRLITPSLTDTNSSPTQQLNPATGRELARLQTDTPITPFVSLSGTPTNYHTVIPGHGGLVDHINSPFYRHMEPQSAYDNTFIGAASATGVVNWPNYQPQATPFPSATPSIVIQPPEQQQVIPSSSESLSMLPFSHVLPQLNNAQNQSLSKVEAILLTDWNYSLVTRVDETLLYTSWIYSDALSKVLQMQDLRNFLRPWPPGHPSFTRAGYDSNGGKYIQLSLKNDKGQVVKMPLSVIDRHPMQETESMRGVDMVLCSDYRYLARLNAQQRSGVVEQQSASMEYVHTSLPLQLSGAAFQSPFTNVVGYDDHIGQASMQSANHLGPARNYAQSMAPSFQLTTITTSQDSSAIPVSSATSLDGSVHAGSAFPFEQAYQNMSWPQDKPGP
ncbi:hypothetical protein F4808DRAFT_261984 [Astrocystis sublimbata]|nr:hypothetical protein F4808DRAFT_261984 [Astrocystis sublimbata]